MDEPEFDTNWCDLPPDFKLQCIQKMPFETRLKLRCTASEERNLVDSAKCHIDMVLIDTDSVHICDPSSSETVFSKRLDRDINAFYEYLFKVGVIQELNFHSDYVNVGAVASFPERAILRVKLLRSFSLTNKEILSVLSKCDEKLLKQVELKNTMDIYEVLENPILLKFKLVIVLFSEDDSLMNRLIQRLIATDAAIGAEYCFVTLRNSSARRKIMAHFKNRLQSRVSQTDRITTNNPSKHILVSVWSSSDPLYRGIVCQVNRSDLLEKEIKDLQLRWVADRSALTDYHFCN